MDPNPGWKMTEMSLSEDTLVTQLLSGVNNQQLQTESAVQGQLFRYKVAERQQILVFDPFNWGWKIMTGCQIDFF